MHVFYTPDIAQTLELPEEEAGHCLRVLRLGVGEEIMLTDGKGCFYRAVISAATQKRCVVKVVEKTEQEPFWKGHLHLALAPTKNMDRMEWLAEKATEIGFDELTFLNCRFSERKVIKTERVEKIVVSAVKQSLKARKPVVNEMTDFRRFMEREFTGQKFIAHCYEGGKASAARRAPQGRGRRGADWSGRGFQSGGSGAGCRKGLSGSESGQVAPAYGNGGTGGRTPDEPDARGIS